MANTTIPSELIQASVALGGSPTTTTQSASDNTTKIATTAYVTAAVNALIDSAPGTMNTLNEIAAALNDDAAFNTTVTNAIATKLPLAGGTMSGNITLGDNNKAIFGAGSDLQIYHNGSNSYIVDGNSGSDLLIQSNNIVLENTSGHNMIHMASGGAVQLYHNNVSKVKTTATGAQIGLNNSTITRLQLYGATNAEHQIKFGNDGTNGEKDGAIRYFGEAHGTTANRRAMTFSTAQTVRIRIDSAGKVGVACTDPQAYFEIDPAAADTAIFSIRRQDHATIPLFKIVQDSSVSQGTGHCHITSSNRDMSITAGENLDKTKGLYIKTTGNVGIGTTSPDTKLSIHEAINTPAIEIVPTADDNNADTAVLRLWGTRFGTANRYSEIRNVTDGSTANNELAFNTNGSERMRIDSGGDLTVGTSSAGFHFDVSTQLLSTTFGTGGNLTLACSNSSGAGLGSEIFLGGSTRGDVNRNSILFKNGASATQYSIDRYGTLMSAAVDSSFAHNTYAHAAVFTRNSTPHGTVVIEDSDVSSGIGNTVLKCYLRDQDPATLANFINFSDGGGTVGSITHNDDGGGVSFNTTSDYRLKENVDYDWDALTLVNQLRPAKFNFISNSAQTVQGFLAHEVSDIVPSSVRGDKDHMMEIGTITDSDGNVVQEEVYEHFCKEGQTWTQTGTEPLYQQLDYARLVPLLTKAIQEQQTIIDDLKSRIETLEG